VKRGALQLLELELEQPDETGVEVRAVAARFLQATTQRIFLSVVHALATGRGR